MIIVSATDVIIEYTTSSKPVHTAFISHIFHNNFVQLGIKGGNAFTQFQNLIHGSMIITSGRKEI
jgi:hypothetical protein